MATEALGRSPLLSGLPPDATARLSIGARKRTFQRGEVIFHKGDPGTSMFAIVDGQVKIVLPSDGGEEALLGVLNAGDYFGELSLIDGCPRSATIIATEATETMMIQRDDFLEALRSSPEVAANVLQVLARRLRETDELVEDAIFLDVPGRLAKKLLELAADYGREGPDGTVIGIRLTQSDLAAMVGATRESVNKHLSAFRARGTIVVERQAITIRRPEDLQRRIY